jgi:aryl-alcohol dehydrogenase-like predicted oxidoreductase
MTHMVVAFTLAHRAVSSAIVGVRRPEQIADPLAGADVRLDDETLKAIDAVVSPGSTVDENNRGFTPWWLRASRMCGPSA